MKLIAALRYVGAALMMSAAFANVMIIVALAKMATPDVLWLSMACDADAHYQGFHNEFECERFYRSLPESYEWGLTVNELQMSVIAAGFIFAVSLVGFLLMSKDKQTRELLRQET